MGGGTEVERWFLAVAVQYQFSYLLPNINFSCSYIIISPITKLYAHAPCIRIICDALVLALFDFSLLICVCVKLTVCYMPCSPVANAPSYSMLYAIAACAPAEMIE